MRKCTVCSNSERESIDLALVEGGSLRDIAGRFGVSRSALSRHKAEHIPATLAMAAKAEETAHADDLLADVRMLKQRALGILEKAEKAGDLRTALAAIRETRNVLELMGQLHDPREPDMLTSVWTVAPDPCEEDS
jgi:transposase-like protein